MCPITTRSLDGITKLLKTAKMQHSITLTRLEKLEAKLKEEPKDGD